MILNQALLTASLRVSAVVITCGVTLANASAAQQKAPPKPAQPSTILRMPAPVRAQRTAGQVSLPERLRLGFALEMDDTAQTGNWDVRGVVTATREGTVTVRTPSASVGHFVYRLPAGLALPLQVDQPVALKRQVIGYGVALGYALTVMSGDRLVLASGRISADTQLAQRIVAGVEITQRVSQRRRLGEGAYETVFQVPVDVVVDGVPLRADTGRTVTFTYRGVDYGVAVAHSSETIPAKGREGVAEGARYSLEYVIVARR